MNELLKNLQDTVSDGEDGQGIYIGGGALLVIVIILVLILIL